MKRAWIRIRIAFGILNIIACGCLLVLYFLFLSSPRWTQPAFAAITWGLPIIVAAILTLIGGIYTLKKKHWGWAVAGLIFAGAVWVYLYIFAFVFSF